MAKIILAEDEDHIAIGVELNLKLQGHEIARARDGVEALELWKKEDSSLMVLDIMMPKMDGIAVLKEIRKLNRKYPILILTAKEQVNDKVYAFKHGVDDYLSKPFVLEEFLVRVERLLERSSWTQQEKNDVFVFGDNSVSLPEMKATTLNGEIELTIQECELLKVFFDKKNIPMSRKDLLELAWGYQGDIETRTLDNFIVRLRRYFEKDPKNPKFFKSVRALGYVFNAQGND